MMVLALLLAAACPTELGQIKLLTDAATVQFKPQGSTVAALRRLPVSKRLHGLRGIAEAQTYSVQAQLVGYKLEDDGDYHVVVRDDAGTMIVELSGIDCGSGHPAEVRAARRQFDSLLRRHGWPLPRAKFFTLTTTTTLQIKGVLFFDKLHGQTGVAPNGVELHPVLWLREVL